RCHPITGAAHGAGAGMSVHATRREALAGLAALALAGCGAGAGLSSAALPNPSLDSLARRGGRRFGSAIGWNAGAAGGSIQNPDYTRIVTAECGIVVPENAMKWQATRPGPETFDFTRMDQIVGWARANALA